MFFVAGSGLTAALTPTGRVTGATALDVDGPELVFVTGCLRTAAVVVTMLLALELWIVLTIAAAFAADGFRTGFVIVDVPGLIRFAGIVSKNA